MAEAEGLEPSVLVGTFAFKVLAALFRGSREFAVNGTRILDLVHFP
jgi:hypothetical protein